MHVWPLSRSGNFAGIGGFSSLPSHAHNSRLESVSDRTWANGLSSGRHRWQGPPPRPSGLHRGQAAPQRSEDRCCPLRGPEHLGRVLPREAYVDHRRPMAVQHYMACAPSEREYIADPSQSSTPPTSARSPVTTPPVVVPSTSAPPRASSTRPSVA